MNSLLIFYLLSTAVALNFDVPCDILEESELVSKPYPYIIRNYSSFNKEFNKLITPQMFMDALENTTIITYQPYNRPTDLKREKFGPMFKNHFLKYENMSMEEILSQKPLDTRVIATHFNQTHDIIPDHILKLFDCSFLGESWVSHTDFFLSAKGQGTNFHLHGEIWTQTTFGKKLWLFAKDKEVLEQIGMTSQQTPAKHIKQLLSSRTVKKCIANKNDVIYIPARVAHGTFNLENTFASSCINTGVRSKKELQEALKKQAFITDKPSTEVCDQSKAKKDVSFEGLIGQWKKGGKMKVETPKSLPMKPGKIITPANMTKVNISLTQDGFSDEIPCNIPEFEKPILYHEPYILRNSSINKEFNKVYTIKNLKEALKDGLFMTMQPLWRPEQYLKASFSNFVDRHLLKYDNMTLHDILDKPVLDTRMPFMRYNTTHPVPPKYMIDLHNCSFARDVAPGNLTTWDYFLSAKGQSVNFHRHNAIFTQTVSGKKLWLLPEDESVLEDLHLSKIETPASNIVNIINHPKVKTCVASTNDIVFIPPKGLHGIFNLETTLAHGCVIFDSKKQYKDQMKFNRHVNIWDL